MERVGFFKREQQERREAQEAQVSQRRRPTPSRTPKPVKREIIESSLMEVVADVPAEPAEQESVVDDVVECEGSGRMRRIRPDALQWLSIADYTTGLFLHYDALKLHFEAAADGDGCYFAKLLNQEFASEHNRLYFTILQPMLTEISDLKQQLAAKEAAARNPSSGDEPNDAHGPGGAGLCAQIESLFLTLAEQVVKSEVLASKSVEELCSVDVSGAGVALPVEQVNYGPNFTTILEASPLAAEEKTKVRQGAMAFLRELFTGLQAVLRNALMILRSADHFSMPNFLDVELEEKHVTAPFFEQVIQGSVVNANDLMNKNIFRLAG